MTTLDNGIVIEEHINATNYTRPEDCLGVFGNPFGITGATVHHWGGDGQDFDQVVAYLASRNDRGNSAHIVLQEDRVSCIVSTDAAAWHSGHPIGNTTTIGIECRPEMTIGDLETLGSVLRYLETVYGSLLIYKHMDWQNTACPGRYVNQIDNLIAEINGVEVWNVPPVAPGEIESQPTHRCCCHD